MSDEDIAKIQRQDGFCRKTIEEIQRRKRKTSDKYHMHNGLLHRYNLDYKQRFQALVIPVSYAKVVLKLAHDKLGHNGTARTLSGLNYIDSFDVSRSQCGCPAWASFVYLQV